MRSKKQLDDLVIRISKADNEALERAAEPRPMTPEAYARFLSQFWTTYEQLRDKPGPRGEPFRL